MAVSDSQNRVQSDAPSFPHIFDKVRIGGFLLKNRIVAAPTGRGDCDPVGAPNDQVICSYVAQAKGGVGLIVVDHANATDKYGVGMAGLLGAFDDRQIKMWRQLADAIHALDTVAVVQLGCGIGRWARRRDSTEIVAPSAVRGEFPIGSAPMGLKRFEGARGTLPRALSTDEVEQLEELYAAAVKRLVKAGFDGVEVHGAHGYLIGQFLSPSTNLRDDKYGGSFENRLTFPKNLIAKTRAVAGKDFIVGFRISGDEHTPEGFTLDDSKAMVPLLIQEGLDYIHLSSGCNSAWRWTFPQREGVIAREAAEIKKIATVPVIAPNIHTPKMAEHVLADGLADLVSLSRALLCDFEWVAKARDGRQQEIVKCVFCCTCLDHLHNGFGTRCHKNPRVGWERFFPEYQPTPKPVPRVRDSK